MDQKEPDSPKRPRKAARMKRIALYARVSTTDQNPEAQLTALREYAQRRGFAIVGEYVDCVTGDMEQRQRQRSNRDQAFQELMMDARRRNFDTVLVWKFDRFARSMAALIEGLQTFRDLGIDFISITQDVDTTTPMGRLFFHVVGAFAEFERALIVERVNSGLANARRKGIRLGRPRMEGEDEVMQLRKQGMSFRLIARETGRSLAGVVKVWKRGKGAV